MTDEIYTSDKARVLRDGKDLYVEVVVGQDRTGKPKYDDAPAGEMVEILKAALIDVDNRRRSAEYDAAGVK